MILNILVILATLILIILTGKYMKKRSKKVIKVWKILCLIIIVICVILIGKLIYEMIEYYNVGMDYEKNQLNGYDSEYYFKYYDGAIEIAESREEILFIEVTILLIDFIILAIYFLVYIIFLIRNLIRKDEDKIIYSILGIILTIILLFIFYKIFIFSDNFNCNYNMNYSEYTYWAKNKLLNIISENFIIILITNIFFIFNFKNKELKENNKKEE